MNMEPYEVRAYLRREAYMRNDVSPLTDGMKGVTVGMLNKHLDGDMNRQVVLSWLFDYNGSGELPLEPFIPKSTHSLTDSQWMTLYMWVKPFKDEVNGGWGCSPEFREEVLAVARIAVPMFYKASQRAFDELLDLPPFMAELKMMGGEITEERYKDGNIP